MTDSSIMDPSRDKTKVAEIVARPGQQLEYQLINCIKGLEADRLGTFCALGADDAVRGDAPVIDQLSDVVRPIFAVAVHNDDAVGVECLQVCTSPMAMAR